MSDSAHVVETDGGRYECSNCGADQRQFESGAVEGADGHPEPGMWCGSCLEVL